jgi:hypothetical protein
MTYTEKMATTVSEINASTSCTLVERATPRYMTTATINNRMMSHTNWGKGSTLNSPRIVSWMVPPIMGRMAAPSEMRPV